MIEEVIKKTVSKDGFIIYNVPFVKIDKESNDYYMSGKVMFKLVDLINSMKENKLKEMDFNDLD